MNDRMKIFIRHKEGKVNKKNKKYACHEMPPKCLQISNLAVLRTGADFNLDLNANKAKVTTFE